MTRRGTTGSSATNELEYSRLPTYDDYNREPSQHRSRAFRAPSPIYVGEYDDFGRERKPRTLARGYDGPDDSFIDIRNLPSTFDRHDSQRRDSYYEPYRGEFDHDRRPIRREIIERVIEHRPQAMEYVPRSGRRGKEVIIETKYIYYPPSRRSRRRRGKRSESRKKGGVMNKTIVKKEKTPRKRAKKADKPKSPKKNDNQKPANEDQKPAKTENKKKKRRNKKPKIPEITEEQLNAELDQHMKTSKHPRIVI